MQSTDVTGKAESMAKEYLSQTGKVLGLQRLTSGREGWLMLASTVCLSASSSHDTGKCHKSTDTRKQGKTWSQWLFYLLV
jgi:hypothetical protein